MHFNLRAFFKTADSQKIRESENVGDFWSINLPRNDDKSNFRVQARSEDFKRGGRDFKCCCVKENFKKLTLLVAFSDQFL